MDERMKKRGISTPLGEIEKIGKLAGASSEVNAVRNLTCIYYVMFRLIKRKAIEYRLQNNDKIYWGQFMESHLAIGPLLEIVMDYYMEDFPDEGLVFDFNGVINRQIEDSLPQASPTYRALYHNIDPDMGVEGFRRELWDFMYEIVNDNFYSGVETRH